MGYPGALRHDAVAVVLELGVDAPRAPPTQVGEPIQVRRVQAPLRERQLLPVYEARWPSAINRWRSQPWANVPKG